MYLISSKVVEGFGTLCISTLLLFLGETKLVIISLKKKKRSLQGKQLEE